MPVLNLSHKELKTRRFGLLTRALGGREDMALGVLAHLWLRCICDKQDSFAEDHLHDFVICPTDLAQAVAQALTLANYLKKAAGRYEVIDVHPWVARAHVRLARAVKAGKQSVKSRAKKKLADKKKQKAALALTAPGEHVSDADCILAARACWEAYACAYERLFHVEPVRNVKVNSLIKQFCKRIPQWDAPHVLAFYVGHGNGFYAQRGYPLDLAVKDAETLHTQWKINRPITRATMEKFEQREKMRATLEEGVIF